MRHLLEWFKDSAGIIFVIGIVSVMFLFFGIFGKIAFTSIQKTDKAGVAMEALPYEKYENTKMTGSEVMGVIKKYQKSLPIRVYNGETARSYRGQFKRFMNSKKSEYYIEEGRYFEAKLVKTKDGVPVSLVFLKEGMSLSEKEYDAILKGAATEKEDGISNRVQKLKDQLLKWKQELEGGRKKMEVVSGGRKQADVQKNNLASQNQAYLVLKKNLEDQIIKDQAGFDKLDHNIAILLEALKTQDILVDGDISSVLEQINKKSAGVKFAFGEIRRIPGSRYENPALFEIGFEPCLIMIKSEVLLTKFDIVLRNDYVKAGEILGNYQKGKIYYGRDLSDEWAAHELAEERIQMAFTRNGFQLACDSNLSYQPGAGCRITYYAFGI